MAKTPTIRTFGATLRAIRLNLGMTQCAFARKIGTQQPNLAAIEAGRRVVSPETARRFAWKLGYDPAEFVRLSFEAKMLELGYPCTLTYKPLLKKEEAA